MPNYPLTAIGGGIEIKTEGPSGDTGSGVAAFIDGVASLNTGRERLSAAEANGLIYAIGGEDSEGNILTSVEEYDPSTKTWTTVASLNTGRERLSAAEANGLIYAIGGEDSGGNVLTSVEEYDPSTDTWTTVASLNTGREELSAAEANGLIYAIGGYDGSNFLASVVGYDPSTDTWSTVASLNTGRWQLSAAEANGLIYAIGGYDGSNVLASVERSKPYETVESASGQLIASTDANNGQVRNPDTGVIAGEAAYEEGDTIQWFAQSGGYLYTIGE